MPRSDLTTRAREERIAHHQLVAAHRALQQKERDPVAQAAYHAALTRWRTALERAYPPGFWGAYDALGRGDPSGADIAIEFLEGDPWFFRSGYVKATLIERLTRLDLSPLHASRLRSVVLTAVDSRDRRELRRYRRLARKVDTPELRKALQSRLDADDPGVRRRARWILDALTPAPAT